MQKKLFTVILFIILSCLLVACDSNKSMESNSKAKEASDKDKSRDKKNDTKDRLIKNVEDVDKSKIEKIISDFDIAGLDKYEISQVEDAYSIHNGDINILIDSNYGILSINQMDNLGKNLKSKFKSKEDIIHFLFSNSYVSADYEVTNVYPVTEDGEKVYITKKNSYLLFNPYDGVKFIYEKATNRILSFERNEDYKTDGKPKISKDEAIEIAKEALVNEMKTKKEDLPEIKEIEYRVVSSRDNIALEKKKVDFAKVYEITFGEYSLTTPEYTVTVDADTKEVILMDAAKSEKSEKSIQ